ncbi:MAG: hypothetical protein A3K19_14815 [Lentisphaerae bacterium RIFOXYB12_FULL_65_16]|nr:MAG: hypothetical protein A3K18_14350 [Lentisphaerae bacterium RIFOXYA12_64_32]OGV87847.1 MAG: hypothetical protein A3K19_14815 [Lentisphaerae bacterium RIFOXYB12_FULL_65_16]
MRRGAADQLTQQVAFRLRLAGIGARFYVFLFFTAALYGLILLSSRILALTPDGFTPLTVLAVPTSALLLAVLFHPRATSVDAARRIDACLHTHDLFLTFTLSGTAPGEFKTLVLAQTEEKSRTVRPATVVSLRCGHRAVTALLVVAVLLLGALFLPQFDPFGKQAARTQQQQRRQWIEESRKATALRADEVRKKQTPEARLSEEAQREIDGLAKAFNNMKPEAKEVNIKQLTEHQKDLGQLWRQLSEKRLQDAFNRAASEQQFGGGDAQKPGHWKRQLEKGNVQGLKDEVKELQEMAQKLAAMPESAAKQQMKAELARRLKTLTAFVENNANSKPLCSALNRAQQQMAMSQSQTGELSQQAMDALQDSLDLAGAEMDTLAHSLGDLASMEEALNALQMAKQLNELGQLDGQGMAGCQSMADYAKLYEELMAKNCKACGGKGCGKCRGKGQGTGGEGIGEGGRPPEDDSQVTAFQSEKSKSALRAGKTLMEWKTKELSQPGQAVVDYREQLREVKQGVSEAILQEQVPPGYHAAIQSYFDSVGKGTDAPTPK